jgi:pyrroloquinoline quinone biosynthesis protein B
MKTHRSRQAKVFRIFLLVLAVFVVPFHARPAGRSVSGPAFSFLSASLSRHSSPVSSPSNPSAVRAVVLGLAQDGGVPHIGCRQPLCVEARRDPARRQRVACLGLVDDVSGRRYLIDATPDIASQIESLNDGRAVANPRRPVDGILLTHAHVGHYAGLMYLGREALGADGVPVHATARMAAFLRQNEPWGQLARLGQIDVREMSPGIEMAVGRFTVTPLLVPHRDELSDTVGFRVRGPARSLLYIPDIDKWERWDRKIADEVAAVDVALLDGTFRDAAEIPGRSLAEIPHPLVGETMALLAAPALRGRVHFIHLNHTNALLWDAEAVRAALARGFHVAREGDAFPL